MAMRASTAFWFAVFFPFPFFVQPTAFGGAGMGELFSRSCLEKVTDILKEKSKS